MRSIVTTDFEHCFLCRRWLGDSGELHHIFGGANRKVSDKYGLVVKLCHTCHNEPPYGVHHNRENELRLKRFGQKAFEDIYGHEMFMKLFGRNYE